MAMAKYDVIQSWLGTVAYSRSGSENTEQLYRLAITRFLDFIEHTPKQVLEEYDRWTDREFRRQYGQYLRAWLSALKKEGYAPITVTVMVSAVKSFFKYSDLPLGYVPVGKMHVKFHNRDITKDEVVQILQVSKPREKAFYCMMAQSGLRPATLCLLKLKHIEPDFSKGVMPCKINVPKEIAKGKYGGFFTFVAEESVKYLKAYLATRPNLSPDDYLFTKQGKPKVMASSKSFSKSFAETIEKLKRKGIMDFEQAEKGKPRTVRLYNLRKFFRKYAHQAGFEFVQFWMGHVVSAGQEEHYRPKDVEFHCKLYTEKAMPYLRFETATPSETEKTITELRQQLENRDREIEELRNSMKKLQPLIDFANTFEDQKAFQQFLTALTVPSGALEWTEASTIPRLPKKKRKAKTT